MQISDLLGKYGQNTVPVTAQEQAVKTGTQQLTGTLSSLQTGNVFEGTVTDISNACKRREDFCQIRGTDTAPAQSGNVF